MTQQVLPKAANFGDLNLNEGVNMEINLQVANIGSIERVGKKQTPCQKCILKDQNGNQSKATVWMGRTGTALADMNLNQWLTFSLSMSKYKGESQYGGFWLTEAPVIQSPPQRAQAAPQQPIVQQPRQSGQMSYPTEYAFPVTPETQERIARSVGVEAASRVVALMLTVPGAKLDPMSEMLTYADALAMFISKGVATPPEPQERVVCTQHGVYTDECGCFLPTGE